VDASPLTGVKHQIRHHFKHLSHPVIGDTSYGKSKHNQLFSEVYDCRHLLLIATRLTLAHPITGERLVLQAGQGRDFLRILRLFEQPDLCGTVIHPMDERGLDTR
jgi:tRNA pseudouridine65 synthase